MAVQTDDPIENFAPSPVHRALDRVTSILLEVQQLQRQVERDGLLPPSLATETIGEIEQRLRRIAGALEAARDGTPPPNTAV